MRAGFDDAVDIAANPSRLIYQMESDESELFKEMSCFFSFGYFDGVIQTASRLLRFASPLRTSVIRYLFVSLAYADQVDFLSTIRRLGIRQDEIFDVVEWLGSLGGCQGTGEVIWLRMQCDEFAELFPAKSNFSLATLPSFAAQPGFEVFSFYHPTCLLNLAEAAVNREHFTSAVWLVNVVMGSPQQVLLASDLRRFARILNSVSAPKAMWADWAFHFVQRMQTLRLLDEVGKNDQNDRMLAFTTFVQRQIEESSRVLTKGLRAGPNELPILVAEFQSLFGVQSFELNEEHLVGKEVDRNTEPPRSDWLSDELRYRRYPWLTVPDMRADDLTHNGDWALFQCPTSDFSMGAAQWWRLLESKLEYILQVQLGNLFDENPEWIAEDRQLVQTLGDSKNMSKTVSHDVEDAGLFLRYAEKGARR